MKESQAINTLMNWTERDNVSLFEIRTFVESLLKEVPDKWVEAIKKFNREPRPSVFGYCFCEGDVDKGHSHDCEKLRTMIRNAEKD